MHKGTMIVVFIMVISLLPIWGCGAISSGGNNGGGGGSGGDFSFGNISVTRAPCELEIQSTRGIHNFASYDVEGYVKNTGSNQVTYGKLKIKLKDVNGGILDTLYKEVRNLDPGDKVKFYVSWWTFEPSKVKSYSVSVIECR